jgi:methylmalonyl-CoA carboxyltransferase large subunit
MAKIPTTTKITMQGLAELLEKVQAQLTAISERVEQLEASGPKQPAALETIPVPVTPETAPQPAALKEEITEEELIAISAALGAYLGVRIRIKQIRLLSSHAWAQQGRASIQASHYLHN